MNDAANTYRNWILEQGIAGCTLKSLDDEHIQIDSEVATGCANFYDIDGTTIIELRLEHKMSGESAFFLHFELEDMDRAKKLFKEMCQVHERMLSNETNHVLLCCSCGITTTFFANKLNENAQSLGLNYDFRAMPLEVAKTTGSEFVAVLLAPQVGHMRKDVVEALPDTLVVELPASIFGAYDAPAALNLVVNAVTGARRAAVSDLRMARDFDHSKCVLAVSFVHREDEPTLSYCVLDRGKRTLSGMLVRQTFDERVLDDVVAALRVAGYQPDQFDAVGIGVPGIVDNGEVLTLHDGSAFNFQLAEYASERWGVPAFVDNNATAAAAGCYVSQTDWDDVAFHAQTVGVPACAEGLVIGGLPRAGRRGFAGSLKYLAGDFSLSMDLKDAAWHYNGMLELIACYLAATICVAAPQAIFVWCDLVPDMDDLREELGKRIPADMLPELVPVSDYDGLVLMGEMSLCLQRLSSEE